MRGFPNVIGGIETHAENLYPRLAAMGCEIVVFTRKPYVDAGLEEYRGVRLVRLPAFRNKHLETFAHTLLAVFAAKSIRPDILHIHAIGPALFVPLARVLGMKVVMTHHGADYERQKWGRLAKFVLRTGERLGCRWANRVICISDHVAAGVRSRCGRDPAVIPNGVEVPDRAYGTDTLEKFGLKKNEYILAVGRLVPEKGFHDLIRAFGLLRDDSNGSVPVRSLNGCKLVIAGDTLHDDAYSSGLKKEAAKGEDVVLTGFLTGMPLNEVYAHARLFVLPSYHEGLPIALLEAMSHGLSCIASDIAANRSAGLPDERYFRAGDMEDLVRKMKEHLELSPRPEAAQEQVRFVAERFSWERIAAETFEVYTDLAGGRQ
jgi:glycosyltransferase involved in cell wall biosynthesis